MLTVARPGAELVEARDEMTAALDDGFARVAEVYAHGRNTLFDQFSMEELSSWDGSEEMTIVSDPDGIDLPDEPPLELAA